MSRLRHVTRRILTAGIALSLFGSATGASAWADQIITNPKKPVEIQLKTDVWGPTSTLGQIFEGQLTDPLQYQNMTLPAGTVFRGQLTHVQHSRRFGRPGYVVMQTDEAELPNGKIYRFDQQPPRNKKTHEKYALTMTQAIVEQAPASAAGLGASIPLSYVISTEGSSFVNPSIGVIGLGVRMLAGSTFAAFRPKYRNEPIPRRIALGALDGSGIARGVGFVNKYPEPEYRAGDRVKIYLNPKALTELFQTASAQTPQPNLSTGPVTPSSVTPAESEETLPGTVNAAPSPAEGNAGVTAFRPKKKP